jgi:hypothetical protein
MSNEFQDKEEKYETDIIDSDDANVLIDWFNNTQLDNEVLIPSNY